MRPPGQPPITAAGALESARGTSGPRLQAHGKAYEARGRAIGACGPGGVAPRVGAPGVGAGNRVLAPVSGHGRPSERPGTSKHTHKKRERKRNSGQLAISTCDIFGPAYAPSRNGRSPGEARLTLRAGSPAQETAAAIGHYSAGDSDGRTDGRSRVHGPRPRPHVR
jgi:hypothetical protein